MRYSLPLKAPVTALALSLAVATALAQPIWPTASNPNPTVPNAAPKPATQPAPVAAKIDVKKEPLIDVTTPHGELLLPIPSADAGKDGYILSVADGKLHIFPKVPAEKMVETLRSENTGDVMFSDSKGGSLWAISGKITDMGSRFYSDLPNFDLPAPRELPKDPANPTALPGTINPVEEGHMYLLATTDGHYAAIRVLDRQPDGILIQYIYQPGNSLNFYQPPHQLQPVHTPQIARISVVGTTTLGPAAAPIADLGPKAPPISLGGPPAPTVLTKPDSNPLNHVLEPTLTSHLLQRQRLIQSRLEILANISTSDQAIERKTYAIEELGELRAGEGNTPQELAAVQALIDNITLMSPAGRNKPFSVDNFYPAVAALRQIGKPASLAAIQAINLIDPSDPNPTDPLKGSNFRIRLYALVVVGVEGPDVGEILLNKAKSKADDSHKPLFDKAIKYLTVP